MSKSATTLTNFRDLPDVELQQTLAKTRDDLFRLHLGQYTNQVTSTAELVTKRRDIARILTILRARELGQEKQGTGAAAAAQVAEALTAPDNDKADKKAKKAAKPAKTKKAKS